MNFTRDESEEYPKNVTVIPDAFLVIIFPV
jgi:hypothetical protein